ncbi:hypothetical protein BP00DRAFT_469767 [Aspergillus indologenus CBS 114.80]|uniref:LysM domain-containing protein n=1 Tax=Aspergillus indologenus CBS 114.80 TaxID=1450541 RepID=A0A2V5HLD5_9EURO|nr:hypothetical protein BP00DRAFT_469767 [Aspergillus indologenus CBS 114.80]
MVYEDTTYPATFTVDNLLYTYDVTCYKDSSTGTFCDLFLAEWRNETNITDTAHDCDDCTLGPMKLQLESPLGYDTDWASEFASLTSSCRATGYSYTSPAGYALSTSTTATADTVTSSATATGAVATQSCSSTYTVQTNDTCNSIAAGQNVSTYNLMIANSINILCTNLPDVGDEVCIPSTCNTTTLLHGDSCNGYEASWNASMAQILSWNPIISDTCDNLDLFVGWTLCTGPTDAWAPATTATTTTAPATAMPLPTNGMSTSNQNCAKWYTVEADDDCATISVANGISTDEFLFLNPEVWSNCTNLWVYYAYCVEAVGDVATYSGWTQTVTTTVFTKPASTTTTWTAGPTYTMPHAPGTETDCAVYRDPYNAATNPMKSLGINTDFLSNFASNFSTCSFYADFFQVTVDEIVGWNPSLNADNCTLDAAYSYCVLISNDFVSSRVSNDTEVDSSCLSVDSTWIVSGTASNCNCYTIIYGKEQDGFDCDMLLETDSTDTFTLSESQLIALNPWIGTGDCTTGLYADLTGEEVRAVCLATGSVSSSTSLTTSTIKTVSPATTTTATSTSSSPATTTTSTAFASVTAQPGEIDTCNQWHQVVSGDTCQSIADGAGISLSTFYEWNPEVGSDCTSMWLGYGVCVGIAS